MLNKLFTDWMGSIQSRTEVQLDRLLPPADEMPQDLHRAMRHAMLGGGKRIRPLLCHAAGEMFTTPLPTLDAASCAVELVHGYSLVHDDLPCMDNDVLRRGKPTCHVEFGEATALLAGDALHSLAFEALAGGAFSGMSAIALLAEAAGARGMAGGQALDLAAVGRPMTLATLETMHVMKTGALIRAAILLGISGGTACDGDICAMSDFADRIGLLFQVVDDILDGESSTATLGKTAGKDARHNKPTYVTLLGPAAARARAEELSLQAHAILAAYGDRADRLHALTDYIAGREH